MKTRKSLTPIVGRELHNDSGWQPGMSLFKDGRRGFANSNGDIDSSSLGYDYAIRTTTFLVQKATKQKFYEVAPADHMVVEVGKGAWMESITENLQYESAGDFEAGVQGIHSGSPDVAEVEVGITPKTWPIVYWAKGYKYNIMEVEKALQADNWDKVDGQHTALKRNWDLGVQKIAFLGSKSNPNILGLLTLDEPTVDTTLLTKNISELAPDEFKAFAAALLGAYWTNSNGTVLPNRLLIPMDDYLGLASPISSAFPVVSPLEYLENAFKKICGSDFKIQGLGYAQKSFNTGYIGTYGAQVYVIYRLDPEVVTLDIPVDFTLTNPGTPNNFDWSGKAYGAYTGVRNKRPREILYLHHTTGNV